MYFMFSVGIFAAVIKLPIGSYLLFTMKKSLYTPYIKIRYSIIITMVATVIVILYNAITNLTSDTKFTLF